MSAYDLETLIGAGMIGLAYVCTMYALPAWIVRRCAR